MSWDGWVNSLVGGGAVSKAGIYGLQGEKWGASAGFNPTADEVKNLLQGFAKAEHLRAEGAKGLVIAGTKYIILKSDNRSIYGKKGAEGVICVKTPKAVVIGHYGDKLQPGAAAAATEKLADQLEKAGY